MVKYPISKIYNKIASTARNKSEVKNKRKTNLRLILLNLLIYLLMFFNSIFITLLLFEPYTSHLFPTSHNFLPLSDTNTMSSTNN